MDFNKLQRKRKYIPVSSVAIMTTLRLTPPSPGLEVLCPHVNMAWYHSDPLRSASFKVSCSQLDVDRLYVEMMMMLITAPAPPPITMTIGTLRKDDADSNENLF